MEWRVSPDNIITLKNYQKLFQASEASEEERNWATTAVNGMTAAYHKGQKLWREPNTPSSAIDRDVTKTSPAARIYVLTDLGCASACLDAVDLWRSLGAVQIGQETSADTLYMDLRNDRLPSEIAIVAIPMKVFRGRERGSNVPWTPVYRYLGDMRDTNAIERWVETLQSNNQTARIDR